MARLLDQLELGAGGGEFAQPVGRQRVHSGYGRPGVLGPVEQVAPSGRPRRRRSRAPIGSDRIEAGQQDLADVRQRVPPLQGVLDARGRGIGQAFTTSQSIELAALFQATRAKATDDDLPWEKAAGTERVPMPVGVRRGARASARADASLGSEIRDRDREPDGGQPRVRRPRSRAPHPRASPPRRHPGRRGGGRAPRSTPTPTSTPSRRARCRRSSPLI